MEKERIPPLRSSRTQMNQCIRVVLLTLLVLSSFPSSGAEPFASSDRKNLIVHQFMRLQRPIQFDQTEYFSEFGSLYEIRLRGAWEIFSNQFTPEELVYSLWALLDDEVFDAETAVTLYGKTGIRFTGRFLAPPFVGGHPSDWGQHRDAVIRSCKWDIRRDLHLDSAWTPHEIVFVLPSDSELKTIGSDPVRRADCVMCLRALLRDEDLVLNNPQEIAKVFHAAKMLDAWELTPEISELFFYDTTTGRDYRMKEPSDISAEGYSEFLSWRSHPDHCLPLISHVPASDILYWRNAEARTNAIPLVLARLSKTDEQGRLMEEGGGFAEAMVIRYLLNPSLQLTQKACFEYIDRLLAKGGLSDSERAAIVHFRATLASGAFQNTEYAVGHDWFGTVPFSFRVLDDGTVLAGKAFGDRFYTYPSRKGRVGRIKKDRLPKYSTMTLRLLPGRENASENQYRLGIMGIRNRMVERELREYVDLTRFQLADDLVENGQSFDETE